MYLCFFLFFLIHQDCWFRIWINPEVVLVREFKFDLLCMRMKTRYIWRLWRGYVSILLVRRRRILQLRDGLIYIYTSADISLFNQTTASFVFKRTNIRMSHASTELTLSVNNASPQVQSSGIQEPLSLWELAHVWLCVYQNVNFHL